MDIRHIAHKQLRGGEGSLRERVREPQSTPTKKAYFHSGWYLKGRNRMKKKKRKKEKKVYISKTLLLGPEKGRQTQPTSCCSACRDCQYLVECQRWSSGRRSSCPHGKHFTHWAISLAPNSSGKEHKLERQRLLKFSFLITKTLRTQTGGRHCWMHIFQAAGSRGKIKYLFLRIQPGWVLRMCDLT